MFRPIKYITAILLILLTVCSCKDEKKVTGISVTPTEMTMAIGETRQIELTINPTSAAIYNSKSWSSSDKSVAVVDRQGNVTAVYAGTCVITATVDGHKASCTVTVVTPEYDLAMTQGTIYITGSDSETGALTQILRLYDDGLIMDEEGNVTGNGLMLNLSLCSPVGADTLAAGNYAVDDSHREFTVRPGVMHSEDSRSYVTGSFLGQYTDNGLNVLLLTAGSVAITHDGTYSVDCLMRGEQQEQVRVTWSGTPDLFRSDTIAEPVRLSYSEMQLRDTLLDGETATRHTLVLLSAAGFSARILFRLPLSATEQLLSGRYTLSYEDLSYTISAEGSSLRYNGQDIEFQTANVAVSLVGGLFAIDGSFRGDDDVDYVISPSK